MRSLRVESKQIIYKRFDSWIISVLLGSPSKRHPVLAQALARLLGSFEHLLSSLRRHRKDIIKSTPERFPPSPPRGQNQWQRTLVMSEVFMYGSAQWVMPFCNTFSTRATRKISAWGLVTEKIPCKREGEMKQSRHVVGIWFGSFRGSFLRTLFREICYCEWRGEMPSSMERNSDYRRGQSFKWYANLSDCSTRSHSQSLFTALYDLSENRYP